MENASKALIIAGAILLVIAIIAIAVGIVSRTRGAIDTAGNQIDTMEVRMHNNQFTNYEGRITGAEVKECIAKVLSNNTQTTNKNMKVYIQIKNSGGTVLNKYGEYYNTSGAQVSAGSTSLSSSDIASNAIYVGTTGINSQGIINTITFTLQ